MNQWKETLVTYVRHRRICFTPSGSGFLFLVALVLLITDISGKSIEETGDFAYTDVDNVEWHQIHVVDGILQEEQHPVVMYKEDFVNEDFVPKSLKKITTTTIRPIIRKYKDISKYRQRMNRTTVPKHPAVKSEKIYFDVLPTTSTITDDDTKLKLPASDVQVDILPLVNDEVETEELPSKQVLNKRPKKYQHRMRRDINEREHIVRKRQPYISYHVNSPHASNYLPPYPSYKSHPVQGNLWNGIDRSVPPPIEDRFSVFDDIEEDERVIWDRYKPSKSVATTPPPPTRPPSIFHDSNPDNADFSFLNRGRTTTSSPNSIPTLSIFHDSNPQHADTSFIARRPIQQNTPTTARPPPMRVPGVVASNAELGPRTESPVTACVWAIVNCCSNRDQEVRYNCFEDHGCSGGFFDLNPCGDFRDKVIKFVGDVIN